MTPTFDKIHLKFKLNGISFNHEELKEVAYSLVKEGEQYEQIIGNFLLDWLDDKDYVMVNTSGSTGAPKSIRLSKQAMVNSSVMTGDFFGIKPGDTALHCLPSKYIAGKMMLVRAMILGLELDIVSPTTMPAYDDLVHYDFCAMVPLQLKNSLHRMANVDKVIVGGARVSKALMEDLQGLKAKVYETYGMTETVSHVAIKPLNHLKHKSTHFKLLPNISVDIDDRNCLVIEAKALTDGKVVTNDIVKMVSANEFDIVGRFDNMINSGGIKMFPEQIESKLQSQIETPFFITSEDDDDLGQRVILILESDTNELDASIFKVLEKFEIPKLIYNIPKFVKTETGKLQRKKTLEAIKGV